MIKSYSAAQDLATQATNDNGNAMKKNEILMDTTAKKVEELKATISGIWLDTVDSSALKGIVGGFTSIINEIGSLIHNFGLIPVVLTTVMVSLALFRKEMSLVYISSNMSNGGFFKGLTVNAGIFAPLINGIKNVRTEYIALRGIGNQNNGFVSGEGISRLSAMFQVLTGKIISQTAATIVCTAATVAFNVALTVGLSFAISKVIEGITSLMNREKELAEANEKVISTATGNITTYQGNIKSLQDLSEEYNTLSSNTNKSAEEQKRYGEITNQIAQMNPELVSGYDKQGNAILNLKDGISGLVEVYKEKIRLENETIVSNGDDTLKSAQDKQKSAKDELDSLQKQRETLLMLKASKEGKSFENTTSTTHTYGNIKEESSKSAQEILDSFKSLKDINSELDKQNQKIAIAQENLKGLNSWYKGLVTSVLSLSEPFQKLDDAQKNFINSYTNIPNIFDGKNSTDIQVEIKKMIDLMSSNDAKPVISKIEDLNGKLKDGTMSQDEYNKEFTKTIEKFKTISSLPPDTLSKIFHLNASDIKDLKTATQSVEELAAAQKKLQSDFQSTFSTASDSVKDYAKYIKEMNDNGGHLGVGSLEDIGKQHAELLPYLNDEKVLYQKIQEEIAKEKKTAQDAYTGMMLSSTAFYDSTIRGTNKIQDALGEYYNKLSEGQKKDLENAKTVAEAKVVFEKQLIADLSNAWADYYKISSDALTKENGTMFFGEGYANASKNPEAQKAYDKAQKLQTDYNGIEKGFSDLANSFGSKLIDNMDKTTEGLTKNGTAASETTYKVDELARAYKDLEVQMGVLDSSLNKMNKHSDDYVNGLQKKQDLMKQELDITNQQIAQNQKLADSYGNMKNLDSYTINSSKGVKTGSDSSSTNTNGTDTGETYSGTYSDLINSAAKNHNVDPNLIAAVMKAESDFTNEPVNSSGAMGLMQVTEDSAEDSGYGGKDLMDVETNVNAGAAELARDLKAFNGNVRLAVAAYNAGIGAVQKAGGVPNYSETQNYVPKVLKNYSDFSGGKAVIPNEKVKIGKSSVSQNPLEAYDQAYQKVQDGQKQATSVRDQIDKIQVDIEKAKMEVITYNNDLALKPLETKMKDIDFETKKINELDYGKKISFNDEKLKNLNEELKDTNDALQKLWDLKPTTEEAQEQRLTEIEKLQDKSRELRSSLKDNIDSIETNIIDMMKKSGEAEKTALDNSKTNFDNIVNAKIKKLDELETKMNYSEDISGKQNERKDITDKITALQGDDSFSSQQQIKDLKKQLKDKDKDISKTQNQHYIDTQKTMYTNTMEEYDKNIDKKKTAIDKSLEDDNLKAQAKKAMVTGIFTDINGQTQLLTQAMQTYTTKTLGSMVAIGDGIQKNIIDKLSMIPNLMQSMNSLGIDVSTYAKPFVPVTTPINSTSNSTANVISIADIAKFDEGGKTPKWSGGEGKLALLHSGEEIRNEEQQNSLFGFIKDFSQSIGNISSNLINRFSNTPTIPNMSNINNSKSVGDTNYTINVSVPNNFSSNNKNDVTTFSKNIISEIKRQGGFIPNY